MGLQNPQRVIFFSRGLAHPAGRSLFLLLSVVSADRPIPTVPQVPVASHRWFLGKITGDPWVEKQNPHPPREKPAPAPRKTRTLAAGRGFPALTGGGFLTGLSGGGGFPHCEDRRVFM